MTPAEKTAQRTAALTTANHIRILCATFKRDLKDMPQEEAIDTAAALLEDGTGPECAMTARQLLRSIPLVKDHKATRLLKRAGIYSGDIRVRNLTARQQLALAEQLRARGWLL